MSPVLTIALKDLRLLLRDKVGLFWCIGFPIIMGSFFGTVFGGGPGAGRGSLRVAIVDEAANSASADLIAALKENESLVIEQKPRAEAVDLVRRAKFVAYLALKPGYEGGFAAFGGGDSGLELGIDPSRKAEAGFLEGILMQAQFQSLTSRFSDRDYMQQELRTARDSLTSATELSAIQRAALGTLFTGLEQFMETADDELLASGPASMMRTTSGTASLETTALARDFTGQPRSSFDISFPGASMWGMLGCAMGFAIGIVIERRQGTYQRLCTAPLGPGRILLGKALGCLIACVADMFLLLGVGRFVFGLHISSPALLTLAIVCTSILFVGLTMMVSVLGRTEASVSGAGWGISLILMMLGGGMIPLLIMPPWMQTASGISPIKWAILSIEGAIWRDFTPAEMLLPCAISVTTGVALFAIGWIIFRRGDNA